MPSSVRYLENCVEEIAVPVVALAGDTDEQSEGKDYKENYVVRGQAEAYLRDEVGKQGDIWTWIC